MKRIYHLIFALIPLLSLGQEKDTTGSLFRFMDWPWYLESGVGLDISTYRDFATSPLIYTGVMIDIPMSIVTYDKKREIRLTMRNCVGGYDIFYGDETAMTLGYTGGIRYMQLWQLKRLSPGNLNFKIGGMYDITAVFRLNSVLMNNASGYEIFGTLSGSAKITYDLSRKSAREFKFLWIPIRLPERRAEIAYRLDVGLMNTSVRNGYAYIGQEVLLNSMVLFDGYQIKAFDGFRIGSQLDFTYFLHNGNGCRVSYIWDAYTTGGDLPKFEMAHHIFELSLLHNLRK